MKHSGGVQLTAANVRMMILGWAGIVLLAGICTFVAVFLLMGNGDNSSGRRPATQSAVVPTHSLPPTLTMIPGITPTVWMPIDDGNFALGGQTFEAPIVHPDLMHNAGMSWVKYQIKWDAASDPDLAKAYIEAAHAAGFKILLSIPGQPYPQEEIDYQAYVAYLTTVASSTPDAIEIWNEMNLNREWPSGKIDPASYLNNMLIPAYNAIKATSPNTMVIIGALAPTGGAKDANVWNDAVYAQELAALGAANYADCVGVHHNAGTTAPSTASDHPYDAGDHHYSWYFQPTIDVYHGAFPTLDVCLTEFGYLSSEGYGELSTDFAWGKTTTVANQAAWLAEGVQMARNSGYVRLVIVWNVDSATWGPAEDPAHGDPQAGFAILRPDKSCPACATLQAVMLSR